MVHIVRKDSFTQSLDVVETDRFPCCLPLTRMWILSGRPLTDSTAQLFVLGPDFARISGSVAPGVVDPMVHSLEHSCKASLVSAFTTPQGSPVVHMHPHFGFSFWFLFVFLALENFFFNFLLSTAHLTTVCLL